MREGFHVVADGDRPGQLRFAFAAEHQAISGVRGGTSWCECGNHTNICAHLTRQIFAICQGLLCDINLMRDQFHDHGVTAREEAVDVGLFCGDRGHLAGLPDGTFSLCGRAIGVLGALQLSAER